MADDGDTEGSAEAPEQMDAEEMQDQQKEDAGLPDLAEEEHPADDGGGEEIPEDPEDESAFESICAILQERPHLAPRVAEWMIPSLTWAPARALTEQRHIGTVASFDEAEGCGAISCQEFREAHSSDVLVHSKQLTNFKLGDEVSFAVLIGEGGLPTAFDLQPTKAAVPPKRPTAPAAPVPAPKAAGAVKAPQPPRVTTRTTTPPSGKTVPPPVRGNAPKAAPSAASGARPPAATSGAAPTPAPRAPKPPATAPRMVRPPSWRGTGAGGNAARPTAAASSAPAAASPNLPAAWQPAPRAQGSAAAAASTNTSAASGEVPSTPEEAANKRYDGHVKNFNPLKGFGFIECPAIYPLFGKDVWVHDAQMGNYQVGDEISFFLQLNKDGHPQAVDLRPPLVGGTSASASAAPAISVGAGGVGAPSKRYSGTVKTINPEKGFNFIECPELHAIYGRDVWVHEQQLGAYTVGDQVDFTMVLNKDGHPQAIDLKGSSGSAVEWASMVGGERHVGTIKALMPEKGFGFIECSEIYGSYGRDVWVHHSQLGQFGVGDKVSFSMVLSQQGHPQGMDLEGIQAKGGKKGASSSAAAAGASAGDGGQGGQRFVGHVKIFLPDKGYGFIDCPEVYEAYGKDVWVHHQQLQGFSAGDKVTFQVTENKDGHPQALGLQSANPVAVQPQVPALKGGRHIGLIKEYNTDKGFGFIECADLYSIYGKDVWVHYTQIGSFGVGQRVAFTVTLNKDGHPQAQNLSSAGGHVPDGKHVGSLKEYHLERGFGFIDCPELYAVYGKDVWVHYTQIGSFGVGDRLKFTCTLNKDGHPQAQDLEPIGAPQGAATPGEGRYSGRVKEILMDKGFGFIDCPQLYSIHGKDTWVHHTQVTGFSVGDKVTFSLMYSKDGHPQATELQSANASGQGGRHVGNVKQILPDKGFGFIDCPELYAMYGKDVWVHHQQLGNFSVGDPVTFSMVLSNKGHPQGQELQHAPNGPRASYLGLPVNDGRHQGTVKSFIPDKGFGFIACAELYEAYGRDVWVHQQQLGKFNVGDGVTFNLCLSKDGHPQAVDLLPAIVNSGAKRGPNADWEVRAPKMPRHVMPGQAWW